MRRSWRLLLAATGSLWIGLGACARAADVPGLPVSTTAASAILHSQDPTHPAWRPYAITLAPAKWIWLPSERTLPNSFVLFRKELDLPSAPQRAEGWISADSRYTLTVNGQRVQWGPAPCDPRNLDADPIDVTRYLRPGKNILGVEVLFFGHGEGTWPGGKPGLILNLDIQCAGQRQQVVTDKSWLSLLDRAHRPGQYKRWFLRSLQEEFDARLHPYGWDTVEFRPDAGWVSAFEAACAPDKGPACRSDRNWSADSVDRVSPEAATLRMRQIPLTRETLIAAKSLAHSGRVHWNRDPADWFDLRMPNAFQVDRAPVAVAQGAGAWELPATPQAEQGVEATFEFTEQIAGFPRFSIEASAGTIVEVMVQESHDPARTRWLDSYHFCWSRFTCREGLNRFEAADYESLRWMQFHIRNAARPVVLREVGVRRREYAWPHEPVVRTSEAPLQRLFDASINTLHNSALDSVVDGGGRERQQYSGDGGHQLQAIRGVFGEYRISARFLRTFSEGLTKSGYFLDCYPAYDRLARLPQRELDSAYWGPLLDHGVGFVFDNWLHYLDSGDRESLGESYPRLLRFADYLWTLRREDGLLPVENLGVVNVWIDHDAYRNQRNRQCAFNLYAAAMYREALAPLTEALGDPQRAAAARRRGSELEQACVTRFWCPERRVFLDNRPWLADDQAPRMSDRALATAILFNQCPNHDARAALDALVNVPREMGLSYPCNAGWRYWALARQGRADVVLADFRTRWATMRSVRENNTLQEPWKVQPDSYSQWSHCPLAPLFVLCQDIVGLRPLAPGYTRLQLRPQLGDLPDLRVITWTPHGPVDFRAQRDGALHQVEVKLPQACQGELLLPASAACSYPRIEPDRLPDVRCYRLPAGGGRFTVPAIGR